MPALRGRFCFARSRSLGRDPLLSAAPKPIRVLRALSVSRVALPASHEGRAVGTGFSVRLTPDVLGPEAWGRHADVWSFAPQAAATEDLPREGPPSPGEPAEAWRVHARLY